MNWKEFLRPNWKKIVIILVLIILTYFFGIVQIEFPLGGKPVRPNPLLLPLTTYLKCSRAVVPQQVPWYCSNDIQVEGDLNNPPGIIFFISNYPVQMLSNIIYWYLLSCLIVWIYHKIKKK